jgi:hypothetical protein
MKEEVKNRGNSMQEKGREMGTVHVLTGRMNALVCMLLLLLIMIVTLITPAAAAWYENRTAMELIDEKLAAIEEDPVINAFLYQRMNEYNESGGINAVKIEVKTDYPWNRPTTLSTCYVIRDDAAQRVAICKSYEGDDGSLWTFYPRLAQARYALDALLSHEVSKGKLLHLAAMEMAMEKENVPELRERIRNSPWVCEQVAGWYGDPLEQVEEEWQSTKRQEQLTRYQRIDLFIMGQQARRIEPFDRSLGRVQREFLRFNTKVLDLMHVPVELPSIA